LNDVEKRAFAIGKDYVENVRRLGGMKNREKAQIRKKIDFLLLVLDFFIIKHIIHIELL
jgi:hypothetical protein